MCSSPDHTHATRIGQGVDTPETWWRLAESLVERVAALRSRVGSSAPTGRPAAESARADRWRAQFPFGDEEFLAARLAADDISEAEFLEVLADEVGTLRSGAPPPAWVRTLEDLYRCPQPHESTLPGLSPSPTDALFPLRCVAPIIDHFANALRRKVIAAADGAPWVPYDAHTVHRFLVGDLVDTFKRMLTPTLVLELNLARLGGQLAGASAAERFGSYLDLIDSPAAALRLLARYPVLAHQLMIRGQHWLVSSVLFLDDLSSDWDAICAWLDSDRGPGMLTGVQTQLGDSHRGGRSVVVATFSSSLRLVYKPRSLAVDTHFQELLGWINARADGLTFNPLKVLDRGTHGWMEFIRPADCASIDGVRRFYERQGGYLALLYLLNGTDFHCENVIAAGEHPVLVDVEAIFHARVPSGRHSVHGIAGGGWETSVLRTGLLPTPMRWADDAAPLDRSGLGAPQSQPSPLGVLCPDNIGTDEMRLVRKRLLIRPPAHWPAVAGQPAAYIDVEAVVRGFGTVYRVLLDHRDELLDVDGPIARFGGDEVRIVLRHTLVYSRLLSESFHPDVLQDALDRDQLFDLLWADVPDNPHLGQVVADEYHDLMNGDVPFFRGHVGSRAAESCTGRRIPDFLPEPTDAPVYRRLLDLDERDLEWQTWLIRASLATLGPARVAMIRHTQASPPPTGASTAARLMAQACRIGDTLETLALRSGDEAGWIGLKHEGRDAWSLRPVGPDLYDGTAGIVLFLAHLGTATGEKRYRSLAAAAARNLQNQVAAQPPASLGIGAFTGAAGLLYLYTNLALLWDKPEWLQRAHAMLDMIKPLIESDRTYDVVGGAAGCIAGLRALHALAPSDELIAAAAACGDHLLRSATRTTPGIGWPSPLYRVPLGGFSHGASGIADALLAVHRLTDSARFRDGALAALDYERSLFDGEAGQWADLRPREHGQPSAAAMATWCHGAAGIGLSRLHMLPSLDTTTLRREIETAVSATQARGFGDNHCLCHGDLGNLDFLLQAGQALDRADWNAAVQRLTLRVLGEVEQGGWRCGINKPVHTPGLMTGLAGIGYGMLRLAHPRTVAPVTTLCMPSLTASRG
jgi:type 2 lantibiotic biosynthesis protein LanM